MSNRHEKMPEDDVMHLPDIEGRLYKKSKCQKFYQANLFLIYSLALADASIHVRNV